MDYPHLLSPMKIGNVEIKNRVVMPAMMLGLGQLNGKPTEQLVDYYEERAKGGVGLIITGITRVNDKTGASTLAQLSVTDDHHIEPLRNFVDKIHRHHCKIFIQLHHPGRQNVSLLIGTVPMTIKLDSRFKSFRKKFYKLSPLGLKLSNKGLAMKVVAPSKTRPCRHTKGKNRALTKQEIKELIQQFIEGAKRVQLSGADGVELHGAHGYLIQQFLSPFTNQRKDEYGGDLHNRMRFVKEIIEGIRGSCGENFPISVRLSVDECYDRIGEPEKGYGLAEGIKIAKGLEEMGVDALNVSSATYETINYWLEPMSFQLGWRAYMAKAIKEVVNIPVIAANFIRSPEQAERQISEGIQDFVALGRPHLADPQWVNKVNEGRVNEIRRCIACLWCFESMEANAVIGLPGECAVNPFMGREKARTKLKIDGANRKVLIIGGGPAGLMAGILAGQRGFKPIIIEKEAQLGGQLQLGNKPPLKEKITWCIEDLAVAARKAGADIIKDTTVSKELVDSMKPYGVIVATGGTALVPNSIKGIHSEHVCTVSDILSGAVVVNNKKVAVIGSGMTGLETAEKLAHDKNMVIIIEMADVIGPKTGEQHKADILPRLKTFGATLMTGCRLVEITSAGVRLQKVINNKPVKGVIQEFIYVDQVVLSLGVRSDNKLYHDIKESVENCYLVGDAKQVGRIAEATKSAYDIVMSL